jgi:hypothetical protein
MKKFKIKKRIPLMICVAAMGLSATSLLEAQSARQNRATPATDATSASSRKTKTEFLRVTQSDTGEPQFMQTAITRYRPPTGELVVDLIGAVHIGERDYFEQLNRQFEEYDVVLYELVAPAGTRIPAGGKRAKTSASPLDLVSWMQQQTQSSLGLESQLELIDYQKSNLKHADMSPTDIGKKMEERGDTAFTVALSAMSEILREQNRAKTAGSNNMANQLAKEGLFSVMNDPLKLKRMMASQFTRTGVMDGGLGKTLNQMLITDRNGAAMKVLNKEIAAGKKKIGIFYGAAHMADFENRLQKELGLSKTKQAWFDAWNLTQSKAPKNSNSPADLLMGLLNDLSK